MSLWTDRFCNNVTNDLAVRLALKAELPPVAVDEIQHRGALCLLQHLEHRHARDQIAPFLWNALTSCGNLNSLRDRIFASEQQVDTSIKISQTPTPQPSMDPFPEILAILQRDKSRLEALQKKGLDQATKQAYIDEREDLKAQLDAAGKTRNFDIECMEARVAELNRLLKAGSYDPRTGCLTMLIKEIKEKYQPQYNENNKE